VDPFKGSRPKERIEAAIGVRVWVQPAVVLWTPFPQRVDQVSDVFFVQGEAITDWLRERKASTRRFDARKVSEFLERTAAAVDRTALVGRSFPAPVFPSTRSL
jgi:hypothetical protein